MKSTMLWLLLSSSALAQSCPLCPVAPQLAPPQFDQFIQAVRPGLEIYPILDDSNRQDGRIGLWHHGVFLGAIDFRDGTIQRGRDVPRVNLIEKFHLDVQPLEKLGKKASVPPQCACKPGECNCANCPKDCVASNAEKVVNYGMNYWLPDADEPAQEHCQVNGVEVGREQLLAAIEQSQPTPTSPSTIPDDSLTPRLLVIGSDSARNQVLSDAQKLSLAAKGLIVEGHSPAGPDSWATSKLYPMPKDPTAYWLLPDGKGTAKVLGCTQGYEEGSAGLERAFVAISKLRDNAGVDPTKAPDPSKAPPPPDPPTPAAPAAAANSPSSEQMIGDLTATQFGLVAGGALLVGGASLWLRLRQ